VEPEAEMTATGNGPGSEQRAPAHGDPSRAGIPAFETAFLRRFGPLPPAPTCPIAWQPAALTPVFYGVRDLGPADGAPVRLRIFFPSLDGAVFSAPLLDGCGRYPLVLFVHGNCSGDPDVFLRWFVLPAQLARAGYVVVVPFLAATAAGIHPSITPHPDLDTLTAVATWARQSWEGRDLLLPQPVTAIVGHSYGALVAARFAAGGGVSAFAGLSGVWEDWPSPPLPISGVPAPILVVHGGSNDLFTRIPPGVWNALPRPRHRVIFTNGRHWDYLSVGAVPCDDPGPRPCPLIASAAADLVTMFLGRYLTPEFATDLPGRIPPTLIPPPLVLTPEQNFYAGGYLNGLQTALNTPGCELTIEKELPTDRMVPYVLYSPQAVARADVLAADLVPRFTGGAGHGVRWVATQSPAGGRTVAAGSTVTMFLRSGPIP